MSRRLEYDDTKEAMTDREALVLIEDMQSLYSDDIAALDVAADAIKKLEKIKKLVRENEHVKKTIKLWELKEILEDDKEI